MTPGDDLKAAVGCCEVVVFPAVTATIEATGCGRGAMGRVLITRIREVGGRLRVGCVCEVVWV